MKKLWKSFSIFVLIISILLPHSFHVVTHAADAESLLTVGEEGLLRFLGIITEKVDYEKGISRGELVSIAAKTMNAEYSGEEQYFYDVVSSHPYYGDICALAELGIVNGVGDGYFSPEEPATAEAAHKIFSLILGYNIVDPLWNWHKMANNIGITEGIDDTADLTYGQVLRMAYNTLHCEMFEGVLYGDEVTYEKTENYYALERYHGLLAQEGILRGYHGTTLDHPDSSIDSKSVLINNTVYECEKGEALFGRAVIYYTAAKKSSAKEKIAYIYANERKNNIVTVSSEDIYGKQGDDFVYYVDDKERKARIATETDVVINGVAYPDYTESDLKPAAGSVTLIDYDDDRVYDVILVESYTYMVLKGVDVEDCILYGKYPEITIGDASREDVLFEVYAGDKLIYPKNLKEGSVVAVKKSLNTTGLLKIKVEFLQDGYQGKIESLSQETIRIGGQEYPLSSGLLKDDELLLADDVTAYLHLGKCAVVVHGTGDADVIGFLLNADSVGTAFTQNLKVQVVDSSKNIQEFSAGDKIIIDGVVFKDIDTALTYLENSAAQTRETKDWPISQLIRYRLNDDGVLTHIDTAEYNSAAETEDTLQRRQGGTTYENLRYNTSNRSFYDATTGEFKFSIRNSSQAIWGVPSSYRDEPEWYTTWLSNATYWVEPYSIDSDSMVADYLVAYTNKMTTVAEAADPYIVTAVETVLDEEGEIVKRIKAVGLSTTPEEWILEDDLVNTDILPGDMVQRRANYQDNRIQAIRVVFRPGTIPVESERYRAVGDAGTTSYSIQLRMAYGTVKAVNGNFINHTSSLVEDVSGVTTTNLNNYMMNSTKVYMYDLNESNPKVKTATKDDILTYSVSKDNPDHVVVCEMYGVLKIVYIIKQ